VGIVVGVEALTCVGQYPLVGGGQGHTKERPQPTAQEWRDIFCVYRAGTMRLQGIGQGSGEVVLGINQGAIQVEYDKLYFRGHAVLIF